ncbi:helix-turn-helix domain-containing protein [Campylobacter lari]|uniref:helix-turn-helix domain-containing protein n=1 Tax=Campylobacter lari TaxID=201 RepID=UPI00126EFE83|nr:helix-turn-helix domain-containing protein [Campylobacter lari]MBT0816209.1 helix-turn-helix domain containing protein [Campylobacter lari]
MSDFDKILNFLRHATSSKTDKEMCAKLDIPYGTLDTWKTRKSIPTKRLYDFSRILGVNIDTIINGDINSKGNENIILQGNNNSVNFPTNNTHNDKLQKFLSLYEKYGNEALLEQFINKLEILKKATEE